MKSLLWKIMLAAHLYFVAAIAVNAAGESLAGSRPNIVIIFTDDQGYADLGCYGNESNDTPRLDRLAEEGTRFTSFYAQAVCGPSRSALLTGRYPMRSGGWGMPASEITWAELMRDAGYQTACIGKWDVSNRKPIIPRMPNAQGFDYYFGPLGANDGGHVAFHENNQAAGGTHDMSSLLHLYTDKAIGFLEHRRDPDQPFALYLCHTMMHMNIDASARFREQADTLYEAVVEEFDYETGRLLDTLDELGLREDTLVIYTSDNGPWNQQTYIDSKRNNNRYQKWKKNHAPHLAGEEQVFWGAAGPFRNGKGSCYEAGYRVPCIVRWPDKVPAGRTSDAVFATIDFMPTFANLAGFESPRDRVIDGIDQTDLLLGRSDAGRKTFLFKNNAIRAGKWKYLRANHKVPGYARDRDREHLEELYNLEEDIGESRNLVRKHPEIANELKQKLDRKISLLHEQEAALRKGAD